ncbi:MAG TPA: tetratricopeptide repeat protein [Usitatibacter sp.]|nr:tetratricopeptide repeat protein [Usitatibacter sp.]
MASTRTWWGVLVAAMAFGVVGPSVADDTPAVDDPPEVDGGSANSEAIYEYLVAEMAAQRGDTEGALAVFHRLARELKDPAIARRAVETAIRARAFGPALESATLLLELDPESSLAREIIAALLANEGDLAKAQDRLGLLLAKNPNRGPMVMQLSYLLAKFPDKVATLAATQSIVQPYLKTPEAHYAIGVAALVAGKVDLAAKEADEALAIQPAWEQGAILKAQVLRKASPSDVLPFYEQFVAEHPRSQDVRMQLGRELAAERKLAEAREQFREAEKLTKSDPQAAYAIGLLSLQLEEYLEAQVAFTRALKQGYREPTSIYLGLGQAAEGLKRYEEAIGWYQKVEAGDWVRAQLKIATLIARQQGLAAGREYLQRIEARTEDDSIQMIQVEAQLLRDAKAWNETYEMLSHAVAKYPDSFELLYDRAMAAERIDKLDVLEADLRKVIKMKPDYAHAYNALGYTLADKTKRLTEAKDLIEKAYKLQPDDPFILDSLGWVYYRMGQTQAAIKHLQTAYGQRPDPEIAAHYGEVLWSAGNHDEARKIWNAALSENPNHETLLAVMAKHQP